MWRCSSTSSNSTQKLARISTAKISRDVRESITPAAWGTSLRYIASIFCAICSRAVRLRNVSDSSWPHHAKLRLMLEHEGDPTIKAEDAQCANGRCNCLEIALAKRKGKFGGHPTVATVLLESSWREQLIADTKDSFAKEALKKLLVIELKTLEEEKKAEEPEPASASPAAKSKEEPERSDPNSPKTALEILLTEKVAELKNKMAKQEKAIEAWKSKFKSCQNNMNFNIRAAAQRADKDL